MVSAVDPTQASFEWDTDGRTVSAGLVWHRQADGQMRRTVHAPGLTVYEDEDGKEVVVKHGRPCAGLIPILNRTRSGHARGHSEITRAVRYATDHGMRAMLGMEYNREFYTTPQRYTVNAYADTMGMDDSGEPGAKERNREAAWNAAMTQHLVIPPTIEEETGRLRSADGRPVRVLSADAVHRGVAGADADHRGGGCDPGALPRLHHREPQFSADAIRQSEARLVKKAELKQRPDQSDPSGHGGTAAVAHLDGRRTCRTRSATRWTCCGVIRRRRRRRRWLTLR
jgi:antitoxin (DNA-binding transcriptional repressor) of toxin-antitoxin stability system